MVNLGTSLVVQCLGVHLPIKGEGVPFLVREDPTCHGATKLCYTATEASTLEPTLSIKRSHHTEKPKHCGGKDPAEPKINEKENWQKKATLKFRVSTESNNKIENKGLYNQYIAIILSVQLPLKVEEEKKHKSSEVEISENICDAADESRLFQQRKSGGNSNQ